MKITVFNGSPRAEKSNTHFMVKEFLEGAEKAGAETENIFLLHHKIHHCMGCFSCWTKTPGVCGINDDMKDLIAKMLKTDIIVFASPVYVGSVTGLMKNFMDRLLPLADPHMEKSSCGIYKHVSRYEHNAKIVLISNCGFPEQIHFDYFRSIFRYLEMESDMEIIAEIYRGGGEILQIDHIMLNLITNNYKKLLRKAGKEVVENLCLSEKTKKELEKPLIPYDMYIKKANDHWNEVLAQLEV